MRVSQGALDLAEELDLEVRLEGACYVFDYKDGTRCMSLSQTVVDSDLNRAKTRLEPVVTAYRAEGSPSEYVDADTLNEERLRTEQENDESGE